MPNNLQSTKSDEATRFTFFRNGVEEAAQGKTHFKIGPRRQHQPGENVCVAGIFGLVQQRQEGAVTASVSANYPTISGVPGLAARPAWSNRTLRRRRSWRTSTRSLGATLGDGAQTASCWRSVGMTDVRRASAVSSPG
jgi:hypothetical protein